MTAPEQDAGDAPDAIDQGKRLIRIGGEAGLSLAERLSERLQRLAWRTPLHGLRLRGRHPLKLVAVPDDPFLGDVARGQALLGGELRFAGEGYALTALDMMRGGWSPRFGDYLHGFAWLRDLSTVATRAQGAPIAEALTRRWLDAHAHLVGEPAWAPGLWGKRLLFWVAHAPLILSSTDLVYRSLVLNTLARGARHLERGADRAPAGLSRVQGWAGVVAAGLLIPGGDPRRAIGEAGLTRALTGAVTPDGGNIARSPMAQIELIECLAMLRACYAARRLDLLPAADALFGALGAALLGVRHADGSLGSWQGGGPMATNALDQFLAAAGLRVRPLRQAREWGYQRLSAGSAVVVVDAAPPPVTRVVAAGCAGTLAFEMSDGPDRLIVNCGGARTAVAQVPAALADGLRTTAAHSTLVLDDSNSTALNADGTLGRGVAEVELTRAESEAASRIEASHDGYARRAGFTHRRTLVLTMDGRELRGEDMLLPAGRKRRRAATPFAVRFHLAPGVQVSPTADGLAALLRLPSGRLWQFRCRGATLAIEESVWIDDTGRPIGTQQLVVAGEAPAGGATVSWALKRAR